MKNDVEQLEVMFAKTIRARLEQVDAFDPKQRYVVYNAAIKSLDNLRQSNKNLPPEIYEERKEAMYHAIKTLEHEFEQAQLEFDNAQPLNEGFHTGLNDRVHSSGTEGHTGKQPGFLNRISPTYLVFISFLVIAGVIIAKETIPSDFFGASGVSADALGFPYTLPVEDNSKVKILARGLGSVDKQQLPREIVYSVGNERDEELESLDIIISGQAELDHLQPQNEPLVLTFDLEKQSAADMELDILVRGLGKSVREQLTIRDNEEAQLFIVTNNEPLQQRAKRIVIRMTVLSKPGEDEKEVTFSLKNLVFNTL